MTSVHQPSLALTNASGVEGRFVFFGVRQARFLRLAGLPVVIPGAAEDRFAGPPAGLQININ
jgi:hypothetical protein